MLVYVFIGILALIGLCVVIGVVEGRAQRTALSRVERVPDEETAR